VSQSPVYQCNNGHHQTSLTSGTIFAATKLVLSIWFLAIYLITQAKSGIAAPAWRIQYSLEHQTEDHAGHERA